MQHQDFDSKGCRTWRSDFALVVAAAFLAGLAGVMVLMAMGVSLEHRIALLQKRLFGPQAIGIWQSDAVLGWVHKPDARGRHRSPPDFDVEYLIDGHGHRVTPGDYDRPKIAFVGGSFTFGHGVSDMEAFPALLAKELESYKVINAGVNAWGTGQALLKIESLIRGYSDIELVVYGFIGHHLNRNSSRRSWLEHIAERDRMNPVFRIEDDSLVGPVVLGVTDGLPDSAELRKTEAAITERLIERMRQVCLQEGIRFLIVALPAGNGRPSPSFFSKLIEPENLLDLRSSMDLSSLRFRYDPHPNASGHQAVAQAIKPWLAAHLEK
jgi:hypothetical protein